MNNKNVKKGFGILEVVIVLTIICVILGALMWIGRAAAANNSHLQQRAEAAYLAQEGIESARQIRDSNWIDGNSNTSWEDFKLASGALIQPNDFSSTVSSVRFKTDFSLGRFALSSLYGATGTNPSDFNDADKIKIDGMEYRRSIYLENYSIPTNGSDGIQSNGIVFSAGNTNFYYVKVRCVVIWGPSPSINSNNKVEVSEILTNWRPNY